MGVEIGTSASTSYGKGNVLMGYGICRGEQKLGEYNTFIGYENGQDINGGGYNVGIGYRAGYNIWRNGGSEVTIIYF